MSSPRRTFYDALGRPYYINSRNVAVYLPPPQLAGQRQSVASIPSSTPPRSPQSDDMWSNRRPTSADTALTAHSMHSQHPAAPLPNQGTINATMQAGGYNVPAGAHPGLHPAAVPRPPSGAFSAGSERSGYSGPSLDEMISPPRSTHTGGSGVAGPSGYNQGGANRPFTPTGQTGPPHGSWYNPQTPQRPARGPQDSWYSPQTPQQPSRDPDHSWYRDTSSPVSPRHQAPPDRRDPNDSWLESPEQPPPRRRRRRQDEDP